MTLTWWEGRDPKDSKFRIVGWGAVCSQLGLSAGQVIELDPDPADSTRLLLSVLSAAAQLPAAAPSAALPAEQPALESAAEDPPIGATVQVCAVPVLCVSQAICGLFLVFL